MLYGALLVGAVIVYVMWKKNDDKKKAEEIAIEEEMKREEEEMKLENEAFEKMGVLKKGKPVPKATIDKLYNQDLSKMYGKNFSDVEEIV